METKYDWDLIQQLKYDDGLSWAEVVDRLDLDVSPKSLATQCSERRQARTRITARGDSDEMSLAAFARKKRLDQKRAACPVCTELSDDVRSQLAAASGQGITRKEQMAWLEEVFGLRVTTHQLSAHFQGRHDDD